jgi:hypothetical protein
VAGKVTGFVARLTAMHVDAAVAGLTWLCGGAYLFIQHTDAPYYLLKLLLYATVVGGAIVLVAVAVMASVNGALRHWARTSGRSFFREFYGVPIVPWLIILAVYIAEVQVIYWIAEWFVLLGT